MYKSVLVAGFALTIALPAGAQIQAPTLPPADTSPISVALTVDASKVIRTIDPNRLGGTNVAYWNRAGVFTNPTTIGWMKGMKPGLIRIPGGSWSDGMMWNGNGIRDAHGKVDVTRIGPDGWPTIDYRGYAPSFAINDKTLLPVASGFNGNVDVKTMQDYVSAIGSHPLVCVNAGTGRPIDAAEWVRWANKKKHYGAHYWEIGNELDGSWEQGHIVPKTNTVLTGEMYAKKFHNFAVAMKAIDPTIAVGGATTGVQQGGFTEAMLKDAGADVDFVSIHTYPGIGGLTNEAALDSLDETVSSEVAQARKYISQYQPQRADKIEIGYSEFNIRRGSSDLFSGLWLSEALSVMAQNGVAFGTQWDTFTHTRGMADGHGLILGDEPYVRKAQYFALALWNNLTGSKVVASTQESKTSVRSFVTRHDDRVVIMLINPNKDQPAQVNVRISGFNGAKQGIQTTLSSGNYYWNTTTLLPEWSTEPSTASIKTGASFAASVPPLSVAYITIPKASATPARLSQVKPVKKLGKPELKFLIPERCYVGDKVEFWLEARKPGSNASYGKPLADAVLTASSNALLDRNRVRLSENMGRFIVQPTSEGDFTLTATVAGSTVTSHVTALSSVPRPIVFWDYTSPDVTDTKLFASDWKLTADYSERANKVVARVDLPAGGVVSSENARVILRIDRLPEKDKLVRDNIRGVVFDLKTSKDFSSDDPNASVQVVMQSPNNYWIVLGSVPLANQTNWKTHQIEITDEKQIQYMASTYNLWFVLRTSKPAKGILYLDHTGFLVR